MEKKKKGNPIIFGAILLGGAVAGIWKNEHRFDYHKAAEATPHHTSYEELEDSPEESLFSFTGKMDQKLKLKGDYVQPIQGYLKITQIAEIYAWERRKDDNKVKWSKRWTSNLQSNEKNKELELKKKLKFKNISPPRYKVGPLPIDADDIQFVDKKEDISTSTLTLTKSAKKLPLKPMGRYFYLPKRGGTLENPALGDERVSYVGLPVPKVATYFGKLEEGVAVAHQAEVKEGIISSLIQDEGILHHLVAGEREVALASIKSHLLRLKKIVRIAGVIAAGLGGLFLFAGLTRFLIFIPGIGPALNMVSGWIGFGLGVSIALVTMALAILTSNPLILTLIIIPLVVGIFFLIKNAKKKRTLVRESLARDLGYTPSEEELREQEYIGLYQLLASDGVLTKKEEKRLKKLQTRNRLSDEKVAALREQATADFSSQSQETRLDTLIRYSLADGAIDRAEMTALKQVAQKLGIPLGTLSQRISQLQTT